jgi:NadR type nicotinamide-nucleotide adenylyltransferase
MKKKNIITITTGKWEKFRKRLNCLMLKKIVIIGPESTGKSTLCEQLAVHYKTLWCPEYAREYLLKHGMNYTYEDLLTIAKGQIELEERVIQSAVGSQQLAVGASYFPLFIDTDMYVMKVWCEFVFGKCHSFILEQIAQRKYDLYLLCNIDLPWIQDELREYPDIETRKKLFAIYRDNMTHQPVPWIVINGDYEERLQEAITAVDKLLSQKE